MMGTHILGLDLGTHTGFARLDMFKDAGSSWMTGEWDFTTSRFDSNSMRYVMFGHELDVHIQLGITMVYYEEVLRHMGTAAAHMYGGFLAKLHERCDVAGVPYQGIPVGTIKKHVTGSGRASKDDMIASVKVLGFNPRTENEADAIGVVLCGMNHVPKAAKTVSRKRKAA